MQAIFKKMDTVEASSLFLSRTFHFPHQLFHISWIIHFVCVHTVECGTLDLQVTVGHTEAAFLWLLIQAGCSVLGLVARLTPGWSL